MTVITLGLCFLYLLESVQGSCVVESHRCNFPFSSGSVSQHYSCQPSNSSGHYCHSQVGTRHVYGLCNGGCYEDEEKVFPIQFEVEDAMAFFCKTAASPCQFPFVWNGVTYTSCTNEGSEFPWCAVEVGQDRELVGNRWGSCDMSTCLAANDMAADPRQARAVFSDQITGVVVLIQQSAFNPLQLEGRMEGLSSGQFRLKVSRRGCDEEKEEVMEEQNYDLIESDGNITMIKFEKWGLSLFDEEENIMGGSLILKEECFLGEGNLDCSHVETVACANIVEAEALSMTMIIVIVLVIFIVIILILVVILIICCVRRTLHPSKSKSHHPDLASIDSIDDPFLESRRSKSPLYDELSIPFIDASLPPTPKTGRTSNPLDILLGKSIGSRTSLSETT